MWLIRSLLRILWTEKKNNQEVLEIANMKRSQLSIQ